jgi:hypothetical protein
MAEEMRAHKVRMEAVIYVGPEWPRNCP